MYTSSPARQSSYQAHWAYFTLKPWCFIISLMFRYLTVRRRQFVVDGDKLAITWFLNKRDRFCGQVTSVHLPESAKWRFPYVMAWSASGYFHDMYKLVLCCWHNIGNDNFRYGCDISSGYNSKKAKPPRMQIDLCFLVLITGSSFPPSLEWLTQDFRNKWNSTHHYPHTSLPPFHSSSIGA